MALKLLLTLTEIPLVSSATVNGATDEMIIIHNVSEIRNTTLYGERRTYG